jgi:hypothetical protein
VSWWSRKKQELNAAGIEMSLEDKPMPIVSGIAEFVREILYDSEVLGRDSWLPLFSIPCGSLIPGTDSIKTPRDTNMWMPQSLPSPMSFFLTGIRCIYFDVGGSVVPVSDAIYWETTLALMVYKKEYWRSPVAHVVDPMILTTPQQWANLSDDRKLALYRRFSRQQVQVAIAPDQIVEPSFPEDGHPKRGVPELKGIYIAPQQQFEVQIRHDGKWPDRRILCVLQGTAERPIL